MEVIKARSEDRDQLRVMLEREIAVIRQTLTPAQRRRFKIQWSGVTDHGDLLEQNVYLDWSEDEES